MVYEPPCYNSRVKSIYRCPYCFSPLTINRHSVPFDTTKLYGVAHCSCDEFPIVAGVYFLIKDSSLSNVKAVELIKHKKYRAAVWSLIASSIKQEKILVFIYYLFSQWNLSHRYYRTFIQLLSRVSNNKSWYRYLLNRNETEDFCLSTLFYKKIRHKTDHIVEIGCGAGAFINSSNLVSKYTGIDNTFLSLLIASCGLGDNEKTFICADANLSLPLQSESADAVFLIDSFCYLFSKTTVLQEINRSLRSKGVCLITNVYERNGKTIRWGYGLSHFQTKALLKETFETVQHISFDKKNQKITYSPHLDHKNVGFSFLAKKYV